MAAAEVVEQTLTDGELIDRVVKGDRHSFDLLYDRYFPRVFAFVNRRLNNRADTEEAVQDVFINVFSALDSFRGESPFAAWVLGVARRTVANRFKKKRHITVPLESDSEPVNIDSTNPALNRSETPLESYECQERIARLRDAADRMLSPDQRELFELHHLQHFSIQEIATRLSKSEDAVKSNLYRARKLLLAR